MAVTLLNKIVLVFILFLIGLSVIDNFKILSPAIIEGNTGSATNLQTAIYKHAAEIEILDSQIENIEKKMDDYDTDIKKLKMDSQSNSDQILALNKSNATNASAQALSPGVNLDAIGTDKSNI
jgi:peptidoglycan hydrolase CwlO-like protein